MFDGTLWHDIGKPERETAPRSTPWPWLLIPLVAAVVAVAVLAALLFPDVFAQAGRHF